MNDKKPYDVVEAENLALRKRLATMEGKLKMQPTAAAEPVAVNPNLMRLIEQKDQTLADYTKELEGKASELQSIVDELNVKNLEATQNLKTVELYKTIVENEPSAIFGLDVNRMVVLFNLKAVEMLGEQVSHAVFSPIESLGLERVHPDIATWVDTVLDSGTAQDTKIDIDGPFLNSQVLIYPLMDGETMRGAIIRISS